MGRGDVRKVICSLGRGSFHDQGGREGGVRRLGALRVTVLKAVQGSAGGGDTWVTRGRRKGKTSIPKNKIYYLGD
jgi:hypothetical protein